MAMITRIFFVLLLLNFPVAADEPRRNQDPALEAQNVLISRGIKLLTQHQVNEAIMEFDKAIAAYETAFGNEKQKIGAARTPQESLLYLITGASKNQTGIVISWVWALGFYYKGYALNELGKIAEAVVYLDRALALSPNNAFFLLERGNLDLKQHDLKTAFQRFETAAGAAVSTSPPQSKNNELATAWRGMGYVLVEQDKLDDAEAMYLKCLDLNKDDKKAAAELKYIRDLRAKAAK